MSIMTISSIASPLHPMLADPQRRLAVIALAILFAVTGGVYYRVHNGPNSMATTVMGGICHFAFNYGMPLSSRSKKILSLIWNTRRR